MYPVSMTESTWKFESKSQLERMKGLAIRRSLWPNLHENLKANHNKSFCRLSGCIGLYDRIYMKIWKQITTSSWMIDMISGSLWPNLHENLKANHNRCTYNPNSYGVSMTESTWKFESKSQRALVPGLHRKGSLWPNLHENLKANHNQTPNG